MGNRPLVVIGAILIGCLIGLASRFTSDQVLEGKKVVMVANAPSFPASGAGKKQVVKVITQSSGGILIESQEVENKGIKLFLPWHSVEALWLSDGNLK